MSKFTLTDVGCFVDGVRGIYAGKESIEIAMEYGFRMPVGYDFGDILVDSDYHNELIDCATEYLNTLCDKDVCFAWIEGDLMLIRQDDLIGVYA